MVRNGKEQENLDFSLVAATFEKTNSYVFAESPIRNAEARSSTLLCSTSNTLPLSKFTAATFQNPTSYPAKTWPEITAIAGLDLVTLIPGIPTFTCVE
jgi:hypothetical protein